MHHSKAFKLLHCMLGQLQNTAQTRLQKFDPVVKCHIATLEHFTTATLHLVCLSEGIAIVSEGIVGG